MSAPKQKPSERIKSIYSETHWQCHNWTLGMVYSILDYLDELHDQKEKER